MINLNYPGGHIRDNSDCIIKKKKVTDNAPIRIYVSKIENGIIFEIKNGY